MSHKIAGRDARAIHLAYLRSREMEIWDAYAEWTQLPSTYHRGRSGRDDIAVAPGGEPVLVAKSKDGPRKALEIGRR